MPRINTHTRTHTRTRAHTHAHTHPTHQSDLFAEAADVIIPYFRGVVRRVGFALERVALSVDDRFRRNDAVICAGVSELQ